MITTDMTALARSAAQRLLEHRFACWFYGDSIGFEGLLAASELTGEEHWSWFARGFLSAWATRRVPFQPDDNTAPGHVLCEIALQTGDAALRAAALDLGQHLRGRRKIGPVSVTFEDSLRSLRAPYGGPALSEGQQEQMKAPGAGIWLDCMHFDPPFFAHLDRLDPQGGWAGEAVSQILGYRELLLDEATGLYRHFWLEDPARAYTDGWGRGQGWALLGLLDVTHLTGDAEVGDECRRLAQRMLDYQLDDGNWYCMVHEAESGPESSTAAFMATAFIRGMTRGILDPQRFEAPAERAYAAMLANMDAEGNLRGVSAAVMSALTQQHYWHVPLDKVVPWGQGPLLTALAARRRWIG